MADIFISYAREDRKTAKVLAEALTHHGWSVWWDQNISPGKTWADVIGKQLVTARCVLTLWSKISVTRRWVLKETRFADRRGTLIPVLIENVESPFEFGDIQTADLTEWRGEVSHPGYKLLLESVSEVLSVSSPVTADQQDAAVAKHLAEEEPTVPPHHPPKLERKLEMASEQQSRPDLSTFRDIDAPWCPEMVVVPAGKFLMGSPDSDNEALPAEKPQHQVQIEYRLAVGRFPVTFDEWEVCVADGGMSYRPSDQGWGRGRKPVINVSWNEAKQYVAWLSRKTGRGYRLLSEAEWEYAARAGTTTLRWWGNDITPQNANYGGNIGKTTEVGNYPESPFKLYDMLGNIWEWVEDCWNDSYASAPKNGAAWATGDCSRRVLCGGSWDYYPSFVRSASRIGGPALARVNVVGFRVARTF